jgi:hypothetical protein
MSISATPSASAVVEQPTGRKNLLPPTITFPSGDRVAAGGQIVIRFEASGDAMVTKIRYSIGGTDLDSEVSAQHGIATATLDVGHVSGERPVYAVAVDKVGRLSTMASSAFTVSVVSNLQGRALDMTTWLPLQGATVRLEPIGIEIVTGTDGTFQFSVEPGLYTLIGTYTGPPSLYFSQQLQLDEYGLNLDLPLFPTSVAGDLA